MDSTSRLNGVPLSTTQMSPKAATFHNIASSGIRAPLTIDESDFEHSISSKSRRNSTTSSYYSGSELESDGYVSGDYDFETASERQFVNDPDEEILEETHFVKEFAFSRPFGKNPNGVRAQESSNGNRYGFSRSLVKNPDGEISQDSGNVVGNAFSRPYVGGRIYEGDSSDSGYDDVVRPFAVGSGEEIVKDDDYVYGDSRSLVAPTNGEVLENEPSTVVSVGMKSHLPIARITGDSDDDSRGSEVSEDGGFSGIARVQSNEVLRSDSFAPRVRILDLEEEEDNESEAENIVEREFVEDLVVDNSVLGSKDEEEQFGIEVTVHDVVSTDMSHDECPDASKELRASSLAADEEYNSMSESERNEDQLHYDEMQETHVADDGGTCVDLVNPRELSDQVEDMMLPGQISSAASAGESECHFETVKPTVPEVTELESSSTVREVCMDDRDSEIRDTGIADNLVLDKDFESDNLENEMEQKIDQRDELSSSIAASKSEYFHQSVEIKEVPSIACSPMLSELHEAPAKIEHADMSNNHPTSDSLTVVSSACKSMLLGSKLDQEINCEAENNEVLAEEAEDLTIRADTMPMVAEIESEQASTSLCVGENIQFHSHEMGDQTVSDSDVEVDAGGETSDGRQTVDSSALAASLKSVRTVSDDDAVTFTSVDDIESFSLGQESADLGSGLCSTVPVTQARSIDLSTSPTTNGKSEEPLSEGEKNKLEKIQQMKVKYLWLLHRLGCSPEDSLAAKVLDQITIAEARLSSRSLSLDSAKKAAMELQHTKNDLDFSLRILVIGKTGVGKSATINSLLGEKKMVTDAFEPATTGVKETIGTIDGIKVKILDTPGLRTSLADHSINRKILLSIKKRMQKNPPDVVLYVDRLDIQSSSFDDLPLLKSVTTYLGSSIWHKSIVALTHAASLPPDGLDGHPLSYELVVTRQSRILSQLISHSVGDPNAIPVSLVENQNGEKLLHSGESWKSRLLLLCCSMKTLSELNSVVATQNPLNQRKLFGTEIRPMSVFCSLSSLLQSNVHSKLCTDESGVEIIIDSDLEHGTSKGTYIQENTDEETGSPEKIAVSLPDTALQPSFDSDNPSLRYQSSEHSSQLFTRPVLDLHGWDHDCGYDSVAIEDKIDFASRIPAAVSFQLSKDKKEFNIQLHSSLLSQFHVGTNLKLNVRAGLNNKRSGQISVRTSSSDQIQIAVIAFLPVAKAIFKKVFPQGNGDIYR